METIELQVQLPATIYPTLTIRAIDWQRAKERLAAGERPTLIGAVGGCGCRGERISGGLDQITLISGPDDFGGFEVESEVWNGWGFTENNCIRLHE